MNPDTATFDELVDAFRKSCCKRLSHKQNYKLLEVTENDIEDRLWKEEAGE